MRVPVSPCELAHKGFAARGCGADRVENGTRRDRAEAKVSRERRRARDRWEIAGGLVVVDTVEPLGESFMRGVGASGNGRIVKAERCIDDAVEGDERCGAWLGYVWQGGAPPFFEERREDSRQRSFLGENGARFGDERAPGANNRDTGLVGDGSVSRASKRR